jgi:bifunctional ADP-heptose synthase (sugar kinase/adenylyltransferase)
MSKRDRIIITTGEFDPISKQDLDYLKRCKSKGDWLCVGIHSDWFMQWARGGYVQDFETRRFILSNIKCVDEIFTFNDTDGTVCQLLKIIKICYPDAELCYVTPDDMHNMPETKIKGITFETMK